MLKTGQTKEETEINSPKYPDIYSKDGLEEELERYTETALNNVHFSLIIKPAIISLVALVFSFFLDLSNVPLLGDVTVRIAQSLFPAWNPGERAIAPYSFWWLPLVIYALFVFLSYLAYNKLKLEIIRTPASETIDRIISSYTSVIDSISTALPLIGAAILLISIKLGEEVFLGLSVPFEVKALIVLALGKLFEPVLDQLGVEFQNIVNHVRDIKERYFSRIQIENSKNLLKQLGSGSGATPRGAEITLKDLENYKSVLEKTLQLSELIQDNFHVIGTILEKINTTQNISEEKIQQLKELANSIKQASNSIGDEKTLAGLKHLETIVTKK
jgi:methyl-accepting chemotaxis protein